MPVSEELLSKMRRTNELFESEVVRKRNAEALDSVYTAGAHVLPPGALMLQGRSQAKGFWEQAIKSLDVRDAKLWTVQAESVADNVIEIGKAELKLGNGQRVEVKYVVRWKQEDGTWKWDIDIWNLNQ